MAHEFERVAVLARAIRDDAIRRHAQVVVAHVSIIGGEEDAVIAGHTGDDQMARAEISQERFECRGEETGVFRF